MSALFATAIGPNSGRLKMASDFFSLAYISLYPMINPLAPVLLRSVSFEQSANVQYVPSLERFMYVYAFGERIGKITVGGFAFWEQCGVGANVSFGGLSAGGSIGSGLLGAAAGSLGVPGFNAILGYYAKRTISKGKPVKITIGGLVFKKTITGFLESVKITATDPDIGLTEFALTFSAMPVEDGSA